MAVVPEKLDPIILYRKALNAYNPNAYPAHKKISAEEWNALLLSGFAQGNRQEEFLEQILNGHLSEIVTTLNTVIDSLSDHDLRIAILETTSATSVARIAALESRMTVVEGINNAQNTRLTVIETVLPLKADKSYVDEKDDALELGVLGAIDRLDRIEDDYVHKSDNYDPYIKDYVASVSDTGAYVVSKSTKNIRDAASTVTTTETTIPVVNNKARLFLPQEIETLQDVKSWKDSLQGASLNRLMDFSDRPWAPAIEPSSYPDADLQIYLDGKWASLGLPPAVPDQSTMSDSSLPLRFTYFLNGDRWVLTQGSSFAAATNNIYDINGAVITFGVVGSVVGTDFKKFYGYVETNGEFTINGLDALESQVLAVKATADANTANKLDKVTNITSFAQVYAKGTSGVQTTLNVDANGPSGITLALRGTDGSLHVGNPTVTTHAAHKKYVDDLISTNQQNNIIQPTEDIYLSAVNTLSSTPPVGTVTQPINLVGTTTVTTTLTFTVAAAGFISPQSRYTFTINMTSLLAGTTYNITNAQWRYNPTNTVISQTSFQFITAGGQTVAYISIPFNSNTLLTNLSYAAGATFSLIFPMSKTTAGNDTVNIISTASVPATFTRNGGIITSSNVSDNDGTTLMTQAQRNRQYEAILADVPTKQTQLISGVNIKSINGESVLGSGNLVVSGGGDSTYNGTVITTIPCNEIKNEKTRYRFDKFYGVPEVNYANRLMRRGLDGIVEAITMPTTASWGAGGAFAVVGNKLYVGSNNGSSTIIAVIDTTTNVAASITMPIAISWGSSGAFAVVGNKLYVGSNNGSSVVAVIDTTTNVAASITMPFADTWGYAGAFALVGNKLYVGSGGNTIIAVIDTTTNVAASITMPFADTWGYAGAFAVIGNKLYVGGTSSSTIIAVIDTTTNVATSITMPTTASWGFGGAFAVIGNKLYVGSGGSSVVAVIDTTTNVAASITMPTAISWGYAGAFAVVGNKLYVGTGNNSITMAVIDTTTNVAASITMPTTASWGTGGSFAVVGNKLYVGSNSGSTIIAVIDTTTNVAASITMPTTNSWGFGGAFIVVGNKLYVGGTSSNSTIIAVIDTTTNVAASITMPSINTWGSSGAFAVVGNKLYVGGGNSSSVVAVIY